MEKEFNKQLSIHLNEWVQNSQSDSWNLTNQPFFAVNDHTIIRVNLNKLSESYRLKHIINQPAHYCNKFLSAIRPYLTQFLVQFGVREYQFRFEFVINDSTCGNFLVKVA